jgi:hypothetical protein
MTARTFAAICGAIYLALAAAGFAPPLWERPTSEPTLSVRVFHASLFGIFNVNLILSMVHLVIGLWAAMAANNRYSSLVFARAGSVVLLLMGIAGLIPVGVVQTVYGLAPLGAPNAWLYLATALVGAIFAVRPGYQLTQVGVQETMNPHLPSK